MYKGEGEAMGKTFAYFTTYVTITTALDTGHYEGTMTTMTTTTVMSRACAMIWTTTTQPLLIVTCNSLSTSLLLSATAYPP